MTSRILNKLCIATLAMLSVGAVNAALFTGASAQPSSVAQASQGATVAVKHVFALTYPSGDTAVCGGRIEYSDGTPGKDVAVRQSVNGAQWVEQKVYNKPGTYKVTLNGKPWGGHQTCLGSQISTVDIQAQAVGKVTSVTSAAARVTPEANGADVSFIVNGVGGNCGLRLSPYTQQDPRPVSIDVKTFPISVNVHFPVTHDNYKMLANGAASSLPPCAGASTVDLEITRRSMNLSGVNMIGKISTPQTNVQMTANGGEVPFTIYGVGNNCSLVVTTNSFPGPQPVYVKVGSFPVTVKLAFPNRQGNYDVHAMHGQSQPGFPPCEGNTSTAFETKVLGAGITGVFLTQSGSTFHKNKPLEFYVDGDTNNLSDSSKQCGWTATLVDSKGMGKVVGTGAVFGPRHTIAPEKLAEFAPGNYTLQAKSTAVDDGLAPMGCTGAVATGVTLVAAVAKITDVKLKAFGQHFGQGSNSGPYSPGGEPMQGSDFCHNCSGHIFSPPHDIGGLRTVPVFEAGEQCSYAFIQNFNGKTKTYAALYTPGNPMAGVDQMKAPALTVFSDDETVVSVTLMGIPYPLPTPVPIPPCEGKVTKSIAVHDDANLPAVSK